MSEFWQKKIAIGKADQGKCILLLNKYKDKAPLLNKKNECPTLSSIQEMSLLFCGNF